MRPIAFFPTAFALLISTAPSALLADTIEARSKVTSVTVFPWGAQVTREVAIEAPEGQHELLIPDLPAGTQAKSLRLAGDVKVGAVSLATDRQAATGDLTSDEIKDARTLVERLEAELAQKRAQIAAIRLKVRASEEQITFLRGMSVGDGAAPDALRDLARMVSEEVLAAANAGHAAEQEAIAAEAALKPDEQALDRARQALAALENTAPKATLSAQVEGSGVLTITTYTDAAAWRPSYDIRLDREANQMEIERSVFISQASGEDWTGVALTLSTARPNEQALPSEIWPRLVQTQDPAAPVPLTKSARAMGAVAETAMLADAGPMATQLEAVLQGETVVYTYEQPVTLRDGVEDVRLSLKTMTLEAEVQAEAVPLVDSTAYLIASAINVGDIMLPGEAVLYDGGALRGIMQLPLITTGDTLRVGFGAINGLQLKRIEPETLQGDRGFITKSNARQEVAVITVENLTDKDWDLRVLDRVPYSEQETLTVDASATPAPSETDVDDKRGVWAWDLNLAAGGSQDIRIQSNLGWPDGQILR
ncbi:DUF4139 domain-containing protein [Albirhodobacter sp. R86504]|uniref:DUF4139 domain-containing protein n=1 Tax=Albirhodobacter sp. R86504 TaxID=3093848 RepID=UPI00366B18DB